MKKAAVLTGATGGIGQHIAEKLHAEGVPLVLVGRSAAKLNQLQQTLYARGEHTAVHSIVCDLADAAQRQALLEQLKALPEGVELLINNAGINDFALFEQQSPEMITQLLQVNALYPLLLTQGMLSLFQAQGGPAQVVNIGSTFGSIAYPGFAAYSASKFALRGATEALAREYADSDIRIRYFAPRATQTSLNSDNVVRMNRELKVAMDTPEQVAQALWCFLQNRKQSAFIGWPEKLFVRINQILPVLVSREIEKILPVIRQYAKV